MFVFLYSNCNFMKQRNKKRGGFNYVYTYVFIVGIILLVVAFAKKDTNSKKVTIALIVIGLVLIGFAVGLAWPKTYGFSA